MSTKMDGSAGCWMRDIKAGSNVWGGRGCFHASVHPVLQGSGCRVTECSTCCSEKAVSWHHSCKAARAMPRWPAFVCNISRWFHASTDTQATCPSWYCSNERHICIRLEFRVCLPSSAILFWHLIYYVFTCSMFHVERSHAVWGLTSRLPLWVQVPSSQPSVTYHPHLAASLRQYLHI